MKFNNPDMDMFEEACNLLHALTTDWYLQSAKFKVHTKEDAAALAERMSQRLEQIKQLQGNV